MNEELVLYVESYKIKDLIVVFEDLVERMGDDIQLHAGYGGELLVTANGRSITIETRPSK